MSSADGYDLCSGCHRQWCICAAAQPSAPVLTRALGFAGEEIGGLKAEVTALKAREALLMDVVMNAWGVIANAGGGDWTTETPTWQQVAARWRDEQFHPLVLKPSGASSWLKEHDAEVRRAAIEEAAKKVEEMVSNSHVSERVAAAIRSLAKDGER